MLFQTSDGTRFAVIRDPHIGREFKNGVPLDRRGEREAWQLRDLWSALNQECDVNVTVGDLFDKPVIPLIYLVKTVELYRNAAQSHPERMFVVMAGNHDISRQAGVVNVFDIFEQMLLDLTNVIVVKGPVKYGHAAFFPWVWGVRAAERVEVADGAEIAFGHWDVEHFGGSDYYMCPARALSDLGVKQIVTGHWHVPGTYKIDGVEVVCTGSLQPYSHSEDPEGEIYVTMTVAEFEASNIDFENKCLRLLVSPDDVVPEGIRALAVTTKRIDSMEGDIEYGAVELGSLNIDQVLEDVFTENDVTDDVRVFIKERLNAAA